MHTNRATLLQSFVIGHPLHEHAGSMPMVCLWVPTFEISTYGRGIACKYSWAPACQLESCDQGAHNPELEILKSF